MQLLYLVFHPRDKLGFQVVSLNKIRDSQITNRTTICTIFGLCMNGNYMFTAFKVRDFIYLFGWFICLIYVFTSFIVCLFH